MLQNKNHRLKSVNILFLIVIIFFIGCNQRTVDPDDSGEQTHIVAKYGTSSTFDIATWNIEQFPLQGSQTIQYVAQLIKDMDIDLFGLQELNDVSAFNQLLDSLPNYDGRISNLPSGTLKLGLIYKKDFISVSNVTQIFTDDWYAFPRPPFTAYIEVKDQNRNVFDFTIFILHLKALSGTENEDRRRDACNKLKEYIDSNLLTSADKDVLVLGDWNDEIDDFPYADNVFKSILDDSSNYTFLSQVLLGQSSYPGYSSLIDHILISNDALSEYGNGNIKILDLDNQFSQYTTYVSDHRPVLAQFPVLNSVNNN